MYRRTIHRGIAALSLVTFLAVAAQPAMAAPDAGFLGRLAGLWSSVVGGESETLWHRLTVWAGGKPAKSPRATRAKLGWGIDPNGRAVTVEEPDPTGPDAGISGAVNNNG